MVLCQNNNSDLDLTILVPKHILIHPDIYHKEILDLLNKRTGQIWQKIYTKRLFILTCDYIYDKEKKPMNIEILFNNITGIMNTDYIKTMAQLDSRFHKIGYYLKWWVNKSNIFTKLNKLNTFSFMCMLIVYLQDIVQPPVLPRILEPYDTCSSLKCYSSPTYIEKDMLPKVVDNKIHVQQYSKNINQILKNSSQNPNPNTDSPTTLFKGFIDYFFNGGGFDHVHDI